LVEQFIRNEKVASSIPASGTRNTAVTRTRMPQGTAGFLLGLQQAAICRTLMDPLHSP
jgi:hypothetical protein